MKSTYEINHETLALLPAKQIDYDSIVIEINNEIPVKQTCFQIIKEACLNDDWCTYEGRRLAVIHHTNFQKRTPIPVIPSKRIYFFPTHSPGNMNNMWIAANEIMRIVEPSEHELNHVKSIVIFKCGKILRVNVSLHTLRVQWERTMQIMYMVEDRRKYSYIGSKKH